MALRQPLTPDLWFLVAPLRQLVTLDHASSVALILALAYLMIVAWALAALAFRRAADAGVSEWIAAYAVAPIVQIPVMLFLCVCPSRAQADPASNAGDVAAAGSSWAPAVQGLIAGVALTLFAVAVGALVFGTYGFGIFVVSPFVIGATTAYFANRQSEIDGLQTAQLVVCATVLGGIALMIAALEGAVCIILAAPLGIGVALMGGALGRGIALTTRRSPTQTIAGAALLPLVFALETILPATTSFDTYETMEVNAPPELVWKSIVHMSPIDAPLALPFRLGVAFPVGGEILGEGVGAVRRGEFSTGTAIERVTEWVPNRRLAFDVSTDVPAMHELSPYSHVHAPHVIGYFRTTFTSFELVQLDNDRTNIIEHTSHQLKLDPVFYWLPLARWIVHENNARVLDHIRRQAERSMQVGG
jgi:hypothetical protein